MMGYSKVTDLIEKTIREASDTLPPIAEMQKLRDELDKRRIYWEDQSSEIICRTWFMWGKKAYSVANGYGTYGMDAGLLELAELKNGGGVKGEPKGWLTAEDVLHRTIGGEEV